MEWHDKNLEWKTGKIELLDRPENEATQNYAENQAGNKTESDDSKGKII